MIKGMADLTEQARARGLILNETKFHNRGIIKNQHIETLMLYMDILLEWNRKVNLTAVTNPIDVIIKHFLDSLTLIYYIPENARCADVGSGAGFPGLPLAITRQDTSWVLIDSLKKRTDFLITTGERLNVTNIACERGRAEDLGKSPDHRDRYDICCARAVAPLRVLTEYCLPFVKKGGLFIAMKGPGAERELLEARGVITRLNGGAEEVRKLRLPFRGIARSLVFIRKHAGTPEGYPRNQSRIKNDIIK